MDLHYFFENNTGTGVLSTANQKGEVNSALFARPHVEHDLAMFICLKRKNLENLQQNPYASYLFRVDGKGYEGVRLTLLLQEIKDDDILAEKLRRRHTKTEEKAYILVFKILKVLPLVGGQEEG
ncbi:pyridoxamine 5'-phosphate oxidase family protein [Sulfurospirillum sp. T05]|uniref:Pyridoxamine 5'-phosphate oxidase family protein n=1 Tax=Sulfurospirillum tamanense TaxID=2813362 RepID=A0ABS2WRR4_9BACT|nr:pyridoxamine 5'-phosphate oxidase family protein [Sulfurospirillum tamanensis]MBN2964330.1 pyridoxamine 5'-phosphate oxidase family protein [Sulfurospirillum tamanensis]